MQTFLSVFHVIVCIVLIILILLQNKNNALQISHSTNAMAPITKRGPEKIVYNLTIIFGILFIINVLFFFFLQ